VYTSEYFMFTHKVFTKRNFIFGWCKKKECLVNPLKHRKKNTQVTKMFFFTGHIMLKVHEKCCYNFWIIQNMFLDNRCIYAPTHPHNMYSSHWSRGGSRWSSGRSHWSSGGTGQDGLIFTPITNRYRCIAGCDVY
jgi:hypothetical protein